MNLLNISGSPHVHSDESTKKIMWRVNLALVPALLCAIAYFGLNALLVRYPCSPTQDSVA